MRHEVAYFLHNVKGAIRIPAGLEPRRCNGSNCDELIYDVPATEKRSATPVSVAEYYLASGAMLQGIAPTAKEDGAGISHHANCPSAAEFRSNKGRS